VKEYPPNDQESRDWNEMLNLSHDIYANGNTPEKQERIDQLLEMI